jgi:carbamoyl-phosphate synthase large subunit
VGPPGDKDALLQAARTPVDGRLALVQQALRAGASVDDVHAATGIDPWFIDQILLLDEVAREVADAHELTRELLQLAKRHGFSDRQVGELRGMAEAVVRALRHALGVRPVYKTVDTCAAEFAATTPYHYSSYDEEDEVAPRERPAVIILGSGPNRIGQGIEFDYSCVHASSRCATPARDRHGQLQPRDGLDRLRHLRPALLRAADARGRAGGRRRGAPARRGRRRRRAARRADTAGARGRSRGGRRADLRNARGGDPPGRGPRRLRRVLAAAGLPAPKHGTATSYDEAREIARPSATRCSSGRPTSSAVAACGSSSTTSSCSEWFTTCRPR